jgi:hypothetical protein
VTNASHAGQSLGAFVLDALDERETAEIKDHLRVCADCRTEYDRLVGLRVLLRTVPQEAWTSPPRPSELGLVRLLARMRDERDRARRRTLGWAATVGVAAASLTGLVTLVGIQHTADAPSAQPGVHATPTSQLTGTNHARGINGQINVIPTAWGTKLNVELTGVAPGLKCRLLVIDTNGHRWVAGSWAITSTNAFYWSGAVALPPSQIARVDVATTRGGTKLLTLI